MFIIDITADVRIVKYGSPSYDVVVEERVNAPGEPERWAAHWRTNEMSNDFSSTESSQHAHALANTRR